jgi:hypothetical protein
MSSKEVKVSSTSKFAVLDLTSSKVVHAKAAKAARGNQSNQTNQSPINQSNQSINQSILINNNII